jgi:hypothetical protein
MNTCFGSFQLPLRWQAYRFCRQQRPQGFPGSSAGMQSITEFLQPQPQPEDDSEASEITPPPASAFSESSSEAAEDSIDVPPPPTPPILREGSVLGLLDNEDWEDVVGPIWQLGFVSSLIAGYSAIPLFALLVIIFLNLLYAR